jgi:large subunit ribosomal protein L6
MSRIANKPIALASNVQFDVKDNVVTVKGPKGELSMDLHESVTVENKDNELQVSATSEDMVYMAGTMRSLISNMVEGVTNGFSKKLQLVGVGYRVAMTWT